MTIRRGTERSECLRACRARGTVTNPNPILWGRDLCLPLTPSTAPARPVAGGRAALPGLPNHYKTIEKSTFRNLALPGTIMPAKSLSSPSQEAPQRLPRGPKTASRGPKTTPRGPKTIPRQPQEAPRQLQEAPRPPREAPRSPQEALR